MWKKQPTDNLSMAYLAGPNLLLLATYCPNVLLPGAQLVARGGEGERESNAADGHSSLKSKASAHAGNKVLGNASHQATTS